MPTEKTIPATPEERALMERLRDAHNRCDTRAVNHLINEVYAHVEGTLRGVTRSYSDSEAAVWAALERVTSRGGVRLWLAVWTAGLKTYAATAARSRHALDAGLIGEKAKGDAMYSTRSTSLDALIEAHGDRMKGAKTLSQLDAERERSVRVVREGFERISGSLTAKQREAVLRYANLHLDIAPAEMATREAVAKKLHIKRQSLDDRLDAVTKKVEDSASLRADLSALVDDIDGRVEREADWSRERRGGVEQAQPPVEQDALEAELARARAILGMAAVDGMPDGRTESGAMPLATFTSLVGIA